MNAHAAWFGGGRRDGLVVLGVALAVRAATLLAARDAPFWGVPLVDESAYLDLARGILAGTPPPHGAWYVAPGYAYFLALVLRLGGGALAVRLVQSACGVATAWLVWRLGRRTCGHRAALAAALLWALDPAVILQEILLVKTALAVLAALGALALVVPPAGRPPTPRGALVRWAASGACLGGAALLRGELVLLGLVLAAAGLVAGVRRLPHAPPRAAPLLFLLALAAPIAVPTLENRAQSGDAVVVAFGGGVNFYIGNNPQADGGYVPLRPDRSDPPQEEADAVLLASRALGHAATPGEVSRWWWEQGLGWWRRQPERALALAAKKLALLWGPWELADTLSTSEARRWVEVLRLPRVAPAVVLPAALAGLWILRRRRDLWPFGAFVLGSTLALVPFFLFERFRLHLVAACVPLAAAAAERAFELARARAWRAFLPGLAATAMVGGVLGLVQAPRDETVLRVNVGEMLFQAGRYPEALEEYEAVRAGSPGAWRVDINIANAEAALGHGREALAALDRVLRRLHAEAQRTGLPSAEELVWCHELAGDLEHDRGDLEAAARHYEAALDFADAAARPALRLKLDACRAAPTLMNPGPSKRRPGASR